MQKPVPPMLPNLSRQTCYQLGNVTNPYKILPHVLCFVNAREE